MSCECHQIGGRFIAEDPDCPAHGREAERAQSHREEIIRQVDMGIQYGLPADHLRILTNVLDYLRSL